MTMRPQPTIITTLHFFSLLQVKLGEEGKDPPLGLGGEEEEEAEETIPM